MAIRCETYARAYDNKPMSEQLSSHTRSTRFGKGWANLLLTTIAGVCILGACMQICMGAQDVALQKGQVRGRRRTAYAEGVRGTV